MFRMVSFAFSVEKSTPAGKSTPAVLVALVTNYSYAYVYDIYNTLEKPELNLTYY